MLGYSFHVVHIRVVMDKTNGSDLLRDFSWPQATLIQDVTKRLNPECVPIPLHYQEQSAF